MSTKRIYVRTRIIDLIFLMLALTLSKLEVDPMFRMFWYFIAGLGFVFVVMDMTYEVYCDVQKKS